MEYSLVIGSLIYLLNTRPDITFAVTKLAKFMRVPGQEHLEHSTIFFSIYLTKKFRPYVLS